MIQRLLAKLGVMGKAAIHDQSERLGALREIDRAILEAESPQAIAQVALKHLERELRHRQASVLEFDFESGSATVLAIHGYAGGRPDPGASVPLEGFDLEELSAGAVRAVENAETGDWQAATDQILYREGIHAHMSIPLLAQEQLIGVLNLGWAEPELPGGAYLEFAEGLAGSLALALHHARLHEQLQDYALELENQTQGLARSNAFITALSEVATRLQTVSDPEQVMMTLGTELKSLGMTCMICLLEPDGQTLVIRYCSMESKVMTAGEKLLGASMVGYRMAREKFRIWPELMEERRAVLMPDVMALMEPLLPGVLKSTIRHVLRLGGLNSDVRVIWLPLVVGRQAVGGMAVWGMDLLEDDVLPLTIFAGQVAIALENAHLYAAEHQRAQELAHTSEQLHRELGERRRVEETLKHYTTELERSNQELQQFAYVASHDLQEPLRMVTSYLQLLERRYKSQLDADADDFIHFAVDGANRMQGLIEGLLTYSQIGTQGAPFELTDCQAVLQRVLANLEVSIRESGALVTCDPLPQVVGDSRQLEQLLQNLIGNAIKFRGKRRPEIHVGIGEEDTSWLFSVRDNGIGIESQHAERIFALFQRLHTQEEYPGTGIGLAICKRIVERHGGRIWVESEPGHGATFYYTIPQRR
jgi:signal transduction histidine kinase